MRIECKARVYISRRGRDVGTVMSSAIGFRFANLWTFRVARLVRSSRLVVRDNLCALSRSGCGAAASFKSREETLNQTELEVSLLQDNEVTVSLLWGIGNGRVVAMYHHPMWFAVSAEDKIQRPWFRRQARRQEGRLSKSKTVVG